MIKGKHVGLRAIEKEDLPLLRDWRNMPSFRKNFREVRELSLQNQYEWFDNLHKTKHINYMFSIIDLETDKLIGAAGLLYINWLIRSADFSFYIGEDELYVGDDSRAKEAAELLIHYGFNNLNLNKIWMELFEFDSKKLDFFTNHQFDFKIDGKLRENCFEDGMYYDSYIISKLKRQFNI
jgi:hypothetical protein